MTDDASHPYEGLIVGAAARAGLGLVVAQLVPVGIVYVNARAEEIFGLTLDELRGRNPFDFVVAEQRELVIDRLRRRLAGEELAPPEVTIVRADGTRINIECRIVELEVDGRQGAAIFLTHVVGTRSADLAADARYRALVDAAPDGVAITRGTRFLYANRAALAIVGCASFEELSRYTLDDLLSPDDLSVMTERTTAITREGVRFSRRDYVVHGLGRDTVVEVSSMGIDFEGAPAVLAFVRDVTETRRAQAELERTQRLAALGTLVAGVAHEVNNPLSFATMAVELLQRFFDHGCSDVESGRTALSNLSSGLQRIGSIVRELRTFARSDEPHFVAVDLSEVLTSALRMTSPLIRRRASLDVEVGSLPPIQSSPGRLEQVFVNLLINAAQSFESDDVASNVVRLRTHAADEEMTISVADNGRGIQPQHLPRIFDPFFTTKPAGEGTGLGLSICHAIVTQHGGRVEVSSTPGRGTTVTVVLKTDQQAPAATLASPSSSRSPLLRQRILVVDDEPAIGRLLRAMLSPHHEVTVAAGGAEAEALLGHGDTAFDVVLCDLTMADVSGTVLFERACARRPELRNRFVFMTGGLFTDDILERTVGLAAPRIEKPFTADDIASVIARVGRASR